MGERKGCSIMNFKGLIKRAENVEKAFKELETDLVDAFDECLNLDDDPPSKTVAVADENPTASNDGSQAEDDAGSPETAPRLTSHTQTRLAALSAVGGLFHDAQEYLEEINAKLSEISTSHHLTREFLNILHGDILRANELELANVGLTTQQRVLSEQLHDAARKQRERESAVEAMQQREKHVSLSIDLDKALKREAEARHRLDEISAIHANQAARLSELLDALGKSEKEEVRLQKSLETAQTKLSEMTEAARLMEGDREAELARNLAEMSGLRSEIQNLQSRLEIASNENSNATSEIARLKAQWNDAIAEKQIADEKLSALTKQNEIDKTNLSTMSANLSQLSLQQASEQIQLDVQKQECEDLRAEVASLNARIKELLPYERLHRVTTAKPREGVVVEINGAVAEAARATSRRRARRSLRATS
jgi:chromosome segregation ATPase